MHVCPSALQPLCAQASQAPSTRPAVAGAYPAPPDLLAPSPTCHCSSASASMPLRHSSAASATRMSAEPGALRATRGKSVFEDKAVRYRAPRRSGTCEAAALLAFRARDGAPGPSRPDRTRLRHQIRSCCHQIASYHHLRAMRRISVSAPSTSPISASISAALDAWGGRGRGGEGPVRYARGSCTWAVALSATARRAARPRCSRRASPRRWLRPGARWCCRCGRGSPCWLGTRLGVGGGGG